MTKSSPKKKHEVSLEELEPLFQRVLAFFEGDKAKAWLWFGLPNPMTGHLSPKNYMALRGKERLLRIVKRALTENEPPEAKPLDKKELRSAVMKLCTPPFKYDGITYVWDSEKEMVADDRGPEGSVTRVRGWGRFKYMDNARELQDEMGEIIAQALTEFWERHSS